MGFLHLEQTITFTPDQPAGSLEEPQAFQIIGSCEAVVTDVKDLALDPASRVQIFPNPSQSSVQIIIDLQDGKDLQAVIRDVNGRIVTTLAAPQQRQGELTLEWDGKLFNGQNAAPGLYYLEIKSSDFQYTGKIIRL